MTTTARASRSSRPIAVDLFSGAGGMSLGFEQAGFDVVAAVEYDPVHAATHAYNFPLSEILCRDVSRISSVEVLGAAQRGFAKLYPGRRWDGVIDALVGGPPCQGFSSGGKRRVEDDRNDLLLEFVRLVEEIRPTVFCLENVAGLLEERYSGVRNEAFSRLERAGYALSGKEKPVNSLSFGVPQSRRRVIVLGALAPFAPIRPVPSNGQMITVREALEGLPSPAAYDELFSTDEVKLDPRDQKIRIECTSTYARVLSGVEVMSGDKSHPRRNEFSRISGFRRTRHNNVTIERFAATAQGGVEPKSRFFRLPLDGPARTLRAGTGSERGSHTSPRPIHPTEDRVITVREAARIHGYPDWFRFHTTNWHGHRQVGNSVPPPLARAAALALLKSLGRRPRASLNQIELGDVKLLGLSGSGARLVVDAIEDELPGTRSRKRSSNVTADRSVA